MADNIPFVAVVWDDAWKSATRDTTLKTVDELHKPILLETRGWLLKQNEGGIQLANERTLDEDETTYRGLSFVPAKMIKEVYEVNTNRKRIPRRQTKVVKEHSNDQTNNLES